jgi:hypothetical protein
MINTNEKHPGGRPPKFNGTRRPITVTLPEETLAQLQAINDDRAKAIVKATDSYMNAGKSGDSMVQIVEVESGIGIILVGSNRILKEIKWMKLVEVCSGRFLLTIPPGTSVDSLEVAITDLVDSGDPIPQKEKDMLKELQNIFKRLRKDKKVTKAEMLFVHTN